jgi:NTE family protein
LAAKYYDHLIFKHASFGDLAARPGCPFVVINATDIALGARFEFTQDQFDLIQSDLSRFPISRAVAASSAVPVVLSPIVLKNYSVGRLSPEPGWIREALTNSAASDRLRVLALQSRSYLDGDRRHFIHLLDGGISDNLGLRGAIDRAMVQEGPLRAVPGPFLEKTRRIAVIIVDAHVDKDYGWDSRERSPRVLDLVGAVARVQISRYSLETLEMFRETAPRLARDLVEASRRASGANGATQWGDPADHILC